MKTRWGVVVGVLWAVVVFWAWAGQGWAQDQAPAPAFVVPPGFAVEKVAGPPLVRYPLFADFDDRGRLFVAEGTGSNLSAAELRSRKLGKILLLEDRDGDGRFDSSKVFADGLVFPQGVLWHDGAVYTASHPSIWRLEDPEGRGVATRRVELVSGFHFSGNGCDIHGPFLGPDGRLYWTDGRHGYTVKAHGETIEGLASRIWRCRTDGSDVERLCGGGFDNPVEIGFTPEGELIGTMDQGPGDCLLHFVEGGVYPMEHPCLKEFPSTGPLLGAVRQYTPVLPAALCGLARYNSAAFGPEFQGCLFSTQYMLHKVVRHDLVREGSTFRANDTDFLTSTAHDLRLTDVLEDADGSLLVVDMGAWFTYGFPGNPEPRPNALGSIYRIRRQATPPVVDPWGEKLQIAARSPEELVPLLHEDRFKVRERAIARLAQHGEKAVPALDKLIRDAGNRSVLERQGAIWALCRMDSPAAAVALRRALDDADAGVRLSALHAVGLKRDREAAARLCDLVYDQNPAVRLKAAEALGRIGLPEAVPALLSSLHDPADRFLEHAIIYALIRIGDRGATAQALADTHPRTRQASLLALDQMKDGQLTQEQVAGLLDSADPDLERTVLEVVARHPGWSKLTGDLVRKRLASPAVSAAQEQTLRDLLVATSRDATIQRIMAEALAAAATSTPVRLLLMQAMAQSTVPYFPASWLAPLGTMLDHGDPAVCRRAITTVNERRLAALDTRLVELSRRHQAPADLRIAALECLGKRVGPLDARAFSFLVAHLSDQDNPLVRVAAARTLAGSMLTFEQKIQLAPMIKHTGVLAVRLLLPVFAQESNRALGISVVGALARSPASAMLSPAELDQTLKRFPPDVIERAGSLRAKLAARQAEKSVKLARLAGKLNSLIGDADQGQELFLSPKVGCYSCHRAVGRGGTVGPDLSRIGKIRSRAELLESIVVPGQTIAPEYRTYQIATQDGRTVIGFLIRDDADAIVARRTDLAEVRIPRNEVQNVAPATSSLMPEGLDELLTPQELKNLVEFLAAQQ
jgi:putative heme-binding domain-containing protein